jgi:hypothetical protein
MHDATMVQPMREEVTRLGVAERTPEDVDKAVRQPAPRSSSSTPLRPRRGRCAPGLRSRSCTRTVENLYTVFAGMERRPSPARAVLPAHQPPQIALQGRQDRHMMQRHDIRGATRNHRAEPREGLRRALQEAVHGERRPHGGRRAAARPGRAPCPRRTRAARAFRVNEVAFALARSPLGGRRWRAQCAARAIRDAASSLPLPPSTVSTMSDLAPRTFSSGSSASSAKPLLALVSRRLRPLPLRPDRVQRLEAGREPGRPSASCCSADGAEGRARDRLEGNPMLTRRRRCSTNGPSLLLRGPTGRPARSSARREEQQLEQEQPLDGRLRLVTHADGTSGVYALDKDGARLGLRPAAGGAGCTSAMRRARAHADRGGSGGPASRDPLEWARASAPWSTRPTAAGAELADERRTRGAHDAARRTPRARTAASRSGALSERTDVLPAEARGRSSAQEEARARDAASVPGREREVGKDRAAGALGAHARAERMNCGTGVRRS